MIKALLKKQLLEISAGIRIGRQRGTLRSFGTLFLIALVLAYLLVLLLCIAGSLSRGIVSILYNKGQGWLYFTVTGGVSLLVAVLSTVFTASSSLFRSKDNEVMLSFPIPVWKILIVRMISIYLIVLLISGVVFLPALLVYMGASHQYTVFLFGIMTWLLIGLSTVGIDCLVGYLLSSISAGIRHKSVCAFVSSLAITVVGIVLYAQSGSFLHIFLAESEAFGMWIRNRIYPLYALGMSGIGNPGGALAFLLISCALLLPAYFLTKHRFLHFSINRPRETSFQHTRTAKLQIHSQRAALLWKEWRGIASDSDYLLNCGFGLIAAVSAGSCLLAMPKAAKELLSTPLFFNISLQDSYLLGCLTALCLSMCNMAAASISIEGDHLSILKTLPIKAEKILYAKADLQYLLCIPAGGFLFAVLLHSAEIPFIAGLPAGIYTLLMLRLFSYVDIIWNLLLPTLTWSNKVVPLKQSLSAGLALISNVLCVLLFTLFYIAHILYGGTVPLSAQMLILAGSACLFLRRWISKQGIRLWNSIC